MLNSCSFANPSLEVHSLAWPASFTAHILSQVEDESKCHIYGSILGVWLTQLPKLAECGADIVASSVHMYALLTAQLLPTPAKSHYTFNLRDLSKVFQGIWMAAASKIEDLPTMLRLW